ncbi:hypothetical protein Tco_0524732 [Tanacetum coccineum]
MILTNSRYQLTQDAKANLDKTLIQRWPRGFAFIQFVAPADVAEAKYHRTPYHITRLSSKGNYQLVDCPNLILMVWIDAAKFVILKAMMSDLVMSFKEELPLGRMRRKAVFGKKCEKSREKIVRKEKKKKIFGVLITQNPAAVFRRSPEFAPSDRHDFWTEASLHIKEGFDRWDLDFEAWKFCFLPGQIASCLVIFFLSCSLFVAIYLDIDSKIMMIVVCL